MLLLLSIFVPCRTERGSVTGAEAKTKRNRLLPGGICADGCAEKITEIFVSALFVVLPLATRHKLFDVTLTKLVVFYALAGLYFAALLAVCAARLIKQKPLGGNSPVLSDWFFAVFIAAGVVSSLISGFAPGAFLASDNRYQGILTLLVYAALLFALRRYGRFTPNVRRAALTAYAVVCGLGILNQMGVDPLGSVYILSESSQSRFTSTIGNIGFYGAYCVLLFPVACFGFLNGEAPRDTARGAAVALIGLFGVMAARTESALLGLLAALAIMPMLCTGDRAFKRFFLALPFLVIAMQLYSLAATALGGLVLSRLMRKLLCWPLSASFLVLTGVLAFAVRRLTSEGLVRIRRAYRAVFFILLGLAVSALVLINLFFADLVPEAVARYAVITDGWGTDRGRIWSSVIKLISTFSPVELAVGGGSGCMLRWDMAHRLFTDAAIDVAHNEYLHFLATHGMIGLAAYLSCIVLSAIRGVKSGDAAVRLCVCGCLAYAVQAVVNIAQPCTTPLFFVLLFLLPAPPAAKQRAARGGNGSRVITAAALAAAAVLATGAILAANA